MSELRTSWRGVFVPAVTPFTEDGAFDEPACRQFLDLLIADGVHGIIVAGSTGEWFALDNRERVRLFEVASEQVAGRVPLLGGTSAITTRDAVSLTREARRLGLDGCLVLPPPYVNPTERELLAHFGAIAEVGLPVMAYNNPPRTGVNITAPLAEKLTAFDAVVAFKDSVKDLGQMGQTIRTVGDRLAVFCGMEPYAFPCLQRGAVGIVAMTPNFLGQRGVALYEYAVAGAWEAARPLERAIDRLYEAFYAYGFSAYAIIKEAMNLLGRPGGWPRPPLLPVDDAGRRRLAALLTELELLPAQMAV